MSPLQGRLKPKFHARRREIGRYPTQPQNEEHLNYTETWLHLSTINFQTKIVTGTVILKALLFTLLCNQVIILN